MTKFRRKPVAIEAVQITDENLVPLLDLSRADARLVVLCRTVGEAVTNRVHSVQVQTLEGVMTGSPGDWLVRGTKGELYPVKADIFPGLYEAEADQATAGEVMPDAVHGWFELSYAQYLTIPRSVLQSMPDGWQARFVRCLEELDRTIDWRPDEGRYWVALKDDAGKKVDDPLADYQRGRRRVPHRSLAAMRSAGAGAKGGEGGGA